MRISRFSETFQKQKKKKYLIIAIIVIVIFSGIYSYLNKPIEVKNMDKSLANIPSQFKKQEEQKINASMAQSVYPMENNQDDDDLWRATGGQQIKDVNANVDNLSKTSLDQENKLADQTKQLNLQNAQIESMNEKLDQMAKQAASQSVARQKLKETAAPVSLIKSGSMDNSAPDNVQADIKQNASDALSSVANVATNQTDSKKPSKDIAEYIPSQSFVKGNLIVSLDANTGGSGNANPTAVLMRITDYAQLPNFFKANVKNCMIGGSGFGNLSTERVDIRLTNLSCVLRNGKSIDVPVSGFVAGEDGKAGIKGRVVTNNGSKLAMAILAGTASGLANAAQMSTQTQMVSPVGVTNTVNPSQAMSGSLAGGAGQGFNLLSNYYSNLLNQITPTIQVSSGRNVTIIFTQGVSLDLPLDGQNSFDNGQSMPIL